MKLKERLENFCFGMNRLEKKLETGKEIKFIEEVKLIKKISKEADLSDKGVKFFLKEKEISSRKAQNTLKRYEIYMQCKKRKGKRTILNISMKAIYKMIKLSPEKLTDLLDLTDNGATAKNIKEYLAKYFPESKKEIIKENVYSVYGKVKKGMSELEISKLASQDMERLYSFLGRTNMKLKSYIKPRKGHNKYLENLDTVMIS